MPVIKPLSSDSYDAPSQFKQPSRKGKKAWRKNVDVTEVQKGLEELNEEIIEGGVIRERDSADLFAIDVKGDSQISKKLPRHASKTLKADEILNKRSALPAVSMRKRASDKTTNGLLPVKRLRSDWVSHKDLARLKRVADGQHETAIQINDATFDLWDAPKEEPEANLDHTKLNVKVPKTMKQAPISLVASGKAVPAVQRPTGGYSYNPVFTDYEERLAGEGEKAVEAEKKRLAAEEADRMKQEAAAKSAAEAEAAEERANMSEWEEDSEWEGFQSGVEDTAPAAKRPKRKTHAQRNRIRRRREEEQLAKHKAAMKARRTQEARIGEIAEELDETAQARALALLAGEDSGSEGELRGTGGQKLRRRQLGKYKLPERDLELVLPDELQDSLRLLRPEGNLLTDRYRSMLVRGKVESRRHIPFHKQAKRKTTEKWTHKDFVL
ncbi:p60 domain protein [Cordyceps fumosorosea ARSEF 2679]|uniref:Ribosome biogenesis protein NOP53 n=1 Tax=Cordyceps fumosorosea (strain ARSEF 2679) TaxID=1081104 RepID=A0A167QNU3_CORFA|nr:p60 domain protein [Cordyceps fumosorosea ARSEF 2679]OAA57809.1 p60 domain protein [Cordyceps fumosorosea ARSEF 2679]